MVASFMPDATLKFEWKVMIIIPSDDPKSSTSSVLNQLCNKTSTDTEDTIKTISVTTLISSIQ